jgi:hypothetical protein
MAISSNAQIEFEAGQVLVNLAALTDSGDHTVYEGASAPWSQASGFTPTIRPNGLATGGAVAPAVSGTNDLVDVSALTCYLAGVLTTVAEDTDVSCSRGADADTHRITSITVTNAGAVAAVAGADGAAFSETRGANGGPPLIPTGSIELAQVRLTSTAAAAISSDEIFDVIGQHCERYDYPAWTIDAFDGAIEFSAELPLIHTGPVTKAVYASYYTPIFQVVAKAIDFKPIESSYSVTSQEYYGGVIGGSSSSLGQGGFTAMLEDGHTDSLLAQAGNNILIRFKQDRNRTPYSLTQGILGITRTFPKTQQVQASCTVTGEHVTVDYTG